MISQQCFQNRDFTPRLTRLPQNHKILLEILTGFSKAGNYTRRLSQRQAQTPRLLTEGCTRVFHAKHRLFLYDRHTRASCRLLFLFPPRKSGRMESEPPSWLAVSVLFACTKVDTCHPGNLHIFHPYTFLPPLGNSRVLKKDLG